MRGGAIFRAWYGMMVRMRPRIAPGFFILGAQKAGTSALFAILAQNRQLSAPVRKELHYFDDEGRFERGPDWYACRFPPPKADAPELVTYEATPCYLFFPQVAQRIHAAFPEAKLVVVLRDPVRRAYSAWNMRSQFKDHPRFAHRYDPRSFEEAVEKELQDGSLSTPLSDYLARGDYAPQLERYFRLFPRERILVVNYRDLQSDQLGTVNRICAFVGVPPMVGDERVLLGRYNERPYSRPIPEAMQERLHRHFAPLHARLEALLGHPMDLVEDRPMTRFYR